MSPDVSDTEQTEERSQQEDDGELVRRIAERVWELWQEELRLERERRGGVRR